MTVEEFSNEFDVLIYSHLYGNNLASGQAFNQLNEYEKSVYLTKAQEELVVEWYNGFTSNRESFESNEELGRYLSGIITDYSTTPTNDKICTLPSDVMYIIREECTVKNNQSVYVTMKVVPISQDKISRINSNPFRRSSSYHVVRTNIAGNIKLETNREVRSYKVVYLKNPSPIVLLDFNNDYVSINGYSEVSECELPSITHRKILERAVLNALRDRSNLTPKS